MDLEQWKPVVGYEGLYEVSLLGRVRSIFLARKVKRKSVILKTFLGGRPGHEYPKVTLCSNGHQRGMKVHVLILEAFVGPRPNGYESRHLNGNRFDARLENLQWGTSAENTQDSIIHGTHTRAEKNGQAKLTSDNIRSIRALAASGTNCVVLGQQFGVSKQQIAKIVRRTQWKSI